MTSDVTQIPPDEALSRVGDLESLEAALGPLPAPTARPVLVVISGLPGAGKSHFSRLLVHRLPLALIQSDVMRKALFPSPSYSAPESAHLFGTCHALIERLLKRGVSVLFDATNLVESKREILYHIAYQLGVALVLVYVKAPPEVVKQRLQKRSEEADARDSSDADWSVYQKMRPQVEPIKHSHLVVDTSKDLAPALSRVARAIKQGMRLQ